MDSKQLLDSLTSHIALYHSSLSSSPSPFSLSKNPRNSILRWFSSLSIPHRQASLTVVDHKYAQILLKMRNRIQSNGHGSFILLPDLPSRYSLPSLCFRKSRGLLSRSAASSASDRSIYDSIRLFSSGSSEKCGCSLGDIDSCTVSEEFVADVDRFVEAMDRVSDGGFLRGEEKDLGSDWFEFSWLKAKGYYGLEAFVANKLELALRLSWINFNCAKRRGPKRKEKAAGAAGVAANVFWRKKGCLDWWDGLDPGVRKKILRTFLGKTAKSLVAAENLIRKPYINWAVKRVGRSLQVLWPRSRTNIFGSNATGLALPTSDVDLVVCLPPVRNLEPIKEAGILEGRNGIKETCLQHAARYLANQEWVKNDSLKTVENTAIPIIMLVAEIPKYLVTSNGNPSIGHITDLESNHVIREQGSVTHRSDNVSWPLGSKMKNSHGMDVKSVRLDISFKSPSHTGLQTTELVRDLTDQFPAAAPLALILKQFLADRSLDHSYSGGLSSYCLVLLITRFLQHEHHVTRAINQNLGSLLMDFLYFFGNVFDPRQMRISIQGSGIYVNRERGHCIDPIHIDDPLYPTNNVGRNCFRIHQCIKAFADAYALLDNELAHLPSSVDDPIAKASFKLLPKIIPSINLV